MTESYGALFIMHVEAPNMPPEPFRKLYEDGKFTSDWDPRSIDFGPPELVEHVPAVCGYS